VIWWLVLQFEATYQKVKKRYHHPFLEAVACGFSLRFVVFDWPLASTPRSQNFRNSKIKLIISSQ